MGRTSRICHLKSTPGRGPAGRGARGVSKLRNCHGCRDETSMPQLTARDCNLVHIHQGIRLCTSGASPPLAPIAKPHVDRHGGTSTPDLKPDDAPVGCSSVQMSLVDSRTEPKVVPSIGWACSRARRPQIARLEVGTGHSWEPAPPLLPSGALHGLPENPFDTPLYLLFLIAGRRGPMWITGDA